jgi:hypothetical protein
MGPELVGPLGFFTMVTVIFVTRSHIGRAIADRIRGGAAGDPHLAAEVESLRSELHLLRGELTEVHERLDFAERLLTRQPEPSRVAEHS